MLHNPFLILRLLLHVRCPSRQTDMVAVSDGFWLRRGYEALTFFGIIVTHSQEEADMLNARFSALKHHEMIHLRQAQSTGDSWLRFYLLYIWYWLKAQRYCRRLPNAGYRLNPFEIEAYRHMNDLGYADRCRKEGATEWRIYAAMPLDERRKFLYRQ